MKIYLIINMMLLSLLSLSVQAAAVSIEVLDAAGTPIENAVVYAQSDSTVTATQSNAVIEQRGKQFNPLVSVVQTGGDITFPNFDSVRHHVYSFSPAKTFELKLYSGVPANPVKFDKAGTVVLGCNIHDTMVAFIHVVDTPYFAKTDKMGKAVLRDLPNGNYTLKAWHYALANENVVVEQTLALKAPQNVVMQLSLKPFNIPARK